MTHAAGDLTKADLLAILDRAKADGKLRTANVLLAGLKQMFRFALVWEIVVRNPLDTVTKRDAGGAEVARDRVLSLAEVSMLAQRLPESGMSERSQAALWIILATGCRVGELTTARWENVDLHAASWHLPETKNGRDHDIHLSPVAIDQFKALRTLLERESDGQTLPWVLPNSRGDGPVDVATFGKQLSDRQRADGQRLKGRSVAVTSLCLPGGRWTSHDLRRTAATLMAQLGVSDDVIDECLNHVIESRVRRTYIRDRRPVEQAKAFDALGALLGRIATASPGGCQSETDLRSSSLSDSLQMGGPS